MVVSSPLPRLHCGMDNYMILSVARLIYRQLHVKLELRRMFWAFDSYLVCFCCCLDDMYICSCWLFAGYALRIGKVETRVSQSSGFISDCLLSLFLLFGRLKLAVLRWALLDPTDYLTNFPISKQHWIVLCGEKGSVPLNLRCGMMETWVGPILAQKPSAFVPLRSCSPTSRFPALFYVCSAFLAGAQ